MPYNSVVTGMVIRRLREKRGMSQEVLSGFAGITRPHLSQVERGERFIRVDTLWRIADALDLRLSDLIRMIEQELASQTE